MAQSLQSWWEKDSVPSFSAQATEEYESTPTEVTIYATITERELTSIKRTFTDFSFVQGQDNAITISGYDCQMLDYGTSLLSAFRRDCPPLEEILDQMCYLDGFGLG